MNIDMFNQTYINWLLKNMRHFCLHLYI